MRIEVLIYCYGAVCLSMIIFNCVCIVTFKNSESRIHKKSYDLEEKIRLQAKLILKEEHVKKEHIEYLEKKLSYVGNLLAFDAALEGLFKEKPEAADRYLHEINSVFVYLTVKYQVKETMQAAYFLYFLAKYRICRYMNLNVMTDMVKDYLKKDSLYCRQNAMKALYSSGNAQSVVEGVKIIEREHIFFHAKILTDGLLTFKGDHNRLIRLFLQTLDEFKIETQASILNYIRFKSGEYCNEMFEILINPKCDRELHFAAIRYFGRYKYEPAYRVLLDFAAETDDLYWNYAAFSASALANYPGEETVSVLKDAVLSSNWYIRFNASQSLNALEVTYHDLIDIMNGSDRYAREMIMYQFDCREMNKKEVAAEI